MPNPNNLLELLQAAPSAETAVILPDAGIRITYQQLRDQVTAMADALASLGIQRGDRVATSLPNGLPQVTSFLAASIAGTAGPPSKFVPLAGHDIHGIVQHPLDEEIAQLRHQHMSLGKMSQRHGQRAHMVVMAMGQRNGVHFFILDHIVKRQAAPA